MRELFAAVDLHSNNGYLAVSDGEDRVLYERRLPNKLSLYLEKLEPFQDRITSVAVESTYNWYWLVDGLIDEGYRVDLVNTTAVKQYDGLKHTNDRHDALHLNHLNRLGILPTGHVIPREMRAIRDLARKRMQLVQTRTRMILSSQNIQQRTLGARMTTNQIKTHDRDSIAAMVSDSNVAMALGSTQAIIISLSDEIRKIEKELLRQVRPTEQWKNLRTVWGVGDVLATVILLETGPITRFKEPGNYASYCRCVDSDRQSNGKSKGEGNVKNGNAFLSWAFVEAANYAQRNYAPANRWYQKKLATVNGKTVVARVALAHKLARATFFVLRDGVVFKPEMLFR